VSKLNHSEQQRKASLLDVMDLGYQSNPGMPGVSEKVIDVACEKLYQNLQTT
jgi:hypothetical protein